MSRIALIVDEDFPGSENRVQRQARALMDEGHQIRVVCAQGMSEMPSWEGTPITRLAVRRRKRASAAARLVEYMRFMALLFWWAVAVAPRWRPDIVQVANPPEWLVLAVVPCRWLTGCRLVLDFHDLMPELMAAKEGPTIATRALQIIEGACVSVADAVLTASPQAADLLTERHSVAATFIANGPDTGVFPVTAPSVRDSTQPLKIVYHGTLAARFGVQCLLEAVSLLSNEGLITEVDIYGDGDYAWALQKLATDRELGKTVRFHGQQPAFSLAPLLIKADVGVVPYVDSAFMRIAWSTKAFEYAALGVPMVLADLPTLRGQVGDDGGEFFSPGDPEDLARALREVSDPDRGLEVACSAQRTLRDGYLWCDWAPRYTAAVTGVLLPLPSDEAAVGR